MAIWTLLLEGEHIGGERHEPTINYTEESFVRWRRNPEIVPCKATKSDHDTVEDYKELSLSDRGLDLLVELNIEHLDDDLLRLVEAAFEFGRETERKLHSGDRQKPKLRYYCDIGRKTKPPH